MVVASREPEMVTSWLIQRLRLPPRTPLMAKTSRVFGGGGLGLAPKAWDLLQEVLDFDYMGAAEYEFGIIPATLGALVRDRDSLLAFKVRLKRADIPPNPEWAWRGKEARKRVIAAAKAAGKKPPRARKHNFVSAQRVVSDSVVLYAIGRRQHRVEIETRISELAKNKLRVRDSTSLLAALDPITDADRERCGWLELDNGFFFFTNETMWRDTASLFGVKHALCGKYLGDNDGTCPQLTCIRDEDHDGLCDNVRGDASTDVAPGSVS